MNILHNFFSKFGFKVLYRKNYQKLMNEFRINKIDLEIISKYSKDLDSIKEYIKLREHSKSQLRQDIFVLFTLNFKKNGFFLEIGAADGITYSNTFLMEKFLSWSGILIEPIDTYSEELKQNRNSIIDNSIMWSNDDIKKKIFINSKDNLKSTTYNLSTKINNNFIEKKTTSLDTLLNNHNINHPIDYCSIDIEGAEVELLKGFNFNTHINVISIEHNFNIKKREQIYEILTSNNFKRVAKNISMFDDYYVNKKIL